MGQQLRSVSRKKGLPIPLFSFLASLGTFEWRNEASLAVSSRAGTAFRVLWRRVFVGVSFRAPFFFFSCCICPWCYFDSSVFTVPDSEAVLSDIFYVFSILFFNTYHKFNSTLEIVEFSFFKHLMHIKTSACFKTFQPLWLVETE